MEEQRVFQKTAQQAGIAALRLPHSASHFAADSHFPFGRQRRAFPFFNLLEFFFKPFDNHFSLPFPCGFRLRRGVREARWKPTWSI